MITTLPVSELSLSLVNGRGEQLDLACDHGLVNVIYKFHPGTPSKGYGPPENDSEPIQPDIEIDYITAALPLILHSEDMMLVVQKGASVIHFFDENDFEKIKDAIMSKIKTGSKNE